MPDNKKILIIDDEIDLCLLLTDYFLRKSSDVIVSHTLTEGRQLLDNNRPDVLFLDNNLPDGEGWMVGPEIADYYPAMFIVFISAFRSAPPDMPEHARYKVIEKPIRFADLDQQFAEF